VPSSARYPCGPMDISVNWLNRYLAPGDATAAEIDEVLTAAGFPIEQTRELPGGDVFMDVEITSNRGDCLSHVGLAREVAACAHARRPRELVLPSFDDPPRTGEVREALTLENRVPEVCPRFTAQVIRGVRVGPSPRWLVELLESVGQRSINNVVDITNWVTLELGHPSHVFDLARLAGPALVVRWARPDERLTTLDAKARTLAPDELVVADAERAQSLAGVIGGQDAEVTEDTTDVVLEVACWDPVTVRRAARRHRVSTDASYRFERGVDPRTLDYPAERAAALIRELAGGDILGGMLDEGRPAEADRIVTMRPSRCEALLGIQVPVGEMIHLLRGLEIEVEQVNEDELRATIPPFRIDLTREVDLVEEVARTKGLDAIPIEDRLEIAPRHPQESERALREIGAVLTGLGFYETTTFSFVRPEQAEAFVEPGLRTLAVDDERRGAEPTLRPSVLPSLLACRKANQDARVEVPGGVRLYERSAAFAEHDDQHRRTVERRTLALLADVPGEGTKRSPDERQQGVRQVRGAIEALCRALAGPEATMHSRPDDAPCAAWEEAAFARLELVLGDETIDLGRLGLMRSDVLDQHGLETPVAAAELDADVLIGLYPPRARVHELPSFPDIERDVSIVVDEPTRWATIADLVVAASLERLEGFVFVGCYRGEQVGAGRKSVTFRLRFRDPDRTLRREEVEPEVERLIASMGRELGAEVRR